MNHKKSWCPSCDSYVISRQRNFTGIEILGITVMTGMTCGLGLFLLPAMVYAATRKCCPLCRTPTEARPWPKDAAG